MRRLRVAFPQTAALALAAAAIWLLAALVVGALLAEEREAALRRATRASEALALVLEENTERTLQAVDITLAGIAEALWLAPELARNDPQFRAALTRRLEALRPYARALYVIGPEGWIIHDTDYPKTPKVSLADRPYFKGHRDNPALERSISDPLQSRSGAGWFFAATRRIGVAGAPFEGIVVAAVQPQYFERLYRRMGLGADDVITLYHGDGVLVARYPGADEAIGKSFAQAALFTTHLPVARSGSYITGSGMLSFERIVSYRALESVPMVVAMARGTRTILAGWRRTAIGAAVAMGSLMLLLGALVAQFHRQQRLRQRAQERLAQTQKLEALGHLTGGIAHDFGNLLNVIVGNLHIISRQPSDAQATAKAVEVAKRAVTRGSELISRLRMIGKRRSLRLEPADLNAFAREASALLRQAAGAQVEIRLELASALAPCLLDQTELEVALVNLVVNAKDAMHGQGRIVLRTRQTRDRVCLLVEDNGPGMTDEVRSRVLEPYYTTKGEAGTGLGLAQVYAFMQQIGGDLRIDSRVGAGTTVELLFRKAGAESLRRA